MRKKDGKDTPRLGKQLPRYRFFLNPYQDARFSTCPQCSNKTGQRKLPLFIHMKFRVRRSPQHLLGNRRAVEECCHAMHQSAPG